MQDTESTWTPINNHVLFFTVKLPAHLEYYLGLYDDAERSISRALELGHEDDGSLQVRLARIHVRRHESDSANAQRHLRAALAAFSEALKFVVVASKAVHYLEVKNLVVDNKALRIMACSSWSPVSFGSSFYTYLRSLSRYV